MLTQWKIRALLILESLQLRADRALDGLRLLRCELSVHAFPDGETNCTRCDATRTEFWGKWVILDG